MSMFATGGPNVFARRAGDVKFSAVAFGEAPPQVKTVQISKVNLHIRLQKAGNEQREKKSFICAAMWFRLQWHSQRDSSNASNSSIREQRVGFTSDPSYPALSALSSCPRLRL